MRTLKVSLAWLGALSAIGMQFSGCNVMSNDCDTYRSCGGSSSAGTTSGGGNEAGESGTSVGGGTAGKGGAGSSGSSSGGKSGMSGTSGTSAGGEGGGAGMGGGGCDTTKSPGEESCLVSDEYAVFVAPNGDDDKNDGLQAKPLASLTKAVEVAAGAKLVLVCDSTYDEHVSIAAGARIHGGFKCTDWSAENAKPLFKPATAGPALKINGVADEVLVEGVSFEVGDAANPSETALTAIVNQSPKVTLRSVSLKAGKGKAGANGTLNNFTFPDATSLNGYPETAVAMGGGEKKCTCQGALMSVGGAGGPPSSSGQNGAKGLPDHGGGLGGDSAAGDCGAGSSGKKGVNAPAASPADGAKIFGDAAISGWQPASGTDGATGSPGQGGGGGASLNDAGHGGGGGCGGCGGNGGTAGQGGGASIALLAIGSPVVLEASSVTTSDAGNGGSGAAGQAGQQDVGSGGNSLASANSCGGGTGGKGGAGGTGGGGAGGISVGIVWKGAMQPTVSADTTITNGKAGAKGTGGVPVTNDGIPGVSQKTLSLN